MVVRARPNLPEHVSRFPSWVKRQGIAREVYGVSASLLSWRDKRAEGRCRMCERPDAVRPLTRHHIVPAVWFRRERPALVAIRNVAPNVVPLCRPCHDLVEDCDELACRMLRKALAADEVAFADQTIGRVWLDLRYPPSPRGAMLIPSTARGSHGGGEDSSNAVQAERAPALLGARGLRR